MKKTVGDYEEFAKKYAANVDTKPLHIYYERPNTLSLLPNSLEGLKVLDLGCGSGWYAEYLMQAKAKVTAVDMSQTMVELTRTRLNGRGNFYTANLEDKLDFLNDASFDIVLAPLVIHYIENWQTLFCEISRVLKQSGCFIFSTHQPQVECELFKLDNYFEKVVIKDFWKDIQAEVTYYHHTFHELSESLYNANMVIERLLEPSPLPKLKETNPKIFETITKKPWFLFVKAIKNSSKIDLDSTPKRSQRYF